MIRILMGTFCLCFLGKDDKKLKADLEEAIREVYLNKEPRLIESVANYKTSR